MNIAHAEDAYLDGKARFETWQAEFMAEWHRPLAEAAFFAVLDSTPPEVQRQLIRLAPDAMRQVAKARSKRDANFLQTP
jgi:hypothetical protein